MASVLDVNVASIDKVIIKAQYSLSSAELTLFINDCQFKIFLYVFKLAQLTSSESKNSFELSTQKRSKLG